MNVCSSFEPNFMTDIRKNYGKFARALFGVATDLFRYLPIATIINHPEIRLFVTHGGVSDQIDLEFLTNKLDRKQFLKVSHMKSDSSVDENSKKQISDLLWSDPIRYKHGKNYPKEASDLNGCFLNKRRNLGCVFGSDVCEAFCAKNKFDWLIRSHEVRENGFSQDQIRCITVFSASLYCNGYNKGAVLRIVPEDTKLRFDKYKIPSLNSDTEIGIHNEHDLIKQFKALLKKNEDELMKRLIKEDSMNTGSISVDKWAEIVSNMFCDQISKEDLIAINNYLLKNETTQKDSVNYLSIFDKKTGKNLLNNNRTQIANMAYLIENLFNLIVDNDDDEDDDKIELSELKKAMDKINSKFNIDFYFDNEQLEEFLNDLDINKTGFIQRDELKKFI